MICLICLQDHVLRVASRLSRHGIAPGGLQNAQNQAFKRLCHLASLLETTTEGHHGPSLRATFPRVFQRHHC